MMMMMMMIMMMTMIMVVVVVVVVVVVMMMMMESVFETSVKFNHLTRLSGRKDFIGCCSRESFKT